uniref:hypothetical protein n=1 Tax=Raoultella ornithinolytica TaxID=54291 RepID=UPI0013C3601D
SISSLSIPSLETPYLTGRYPDADDAVDQWLFKSNGFDAYMENAEIIVKLTKKSIHRTPKTISKLVSETRRIIKWKFNDRDITYTSKIDDKTGGCVTSAEEGKSDPWYSETVIEGRANDFIIAMLNAFAKTNDKPDFTFVAL